MQLINTQEFVANLKSIIAQGDTGRVLDVLVKYVDADNNLYNDFVHLKSQWEVVSRQEHLSIEKETAISKNKITESTLWCLAKLQTENHHGLLVNTVTTSQPNHARVQQRPVAQAKKPTQAKKSTTPAKPRKKSNATIDIPAAIEKGGNKIGGYFKAIGFTVFILFFVWLCFFSSAFDKTDKNQVGQVILLNEYEELDPAILEKTKYGQKWNISVFHIASELKPYKVSIVNPQNLQVELKNAKAHWPNARIENLQASCTNPQYNPNTGAIDCKE
jgi:Effector-associated domain 11